MSTRTEHLQAGRAPQAIRVGPAAAIGLALLVLGLAVGLIVGRLQTGGAEPAAVDPVAAAAPAAANVPVLDWRDDYGTRHRAVAGRPQLDWREDYGTRHPLVTAEAPVLSWRDDYGTRHPGERP
jgi:hypothetical protein